MFNREVETHIEINAAPSAVWETLTALELYSDWNPMIRQASGRVAVGERLLLHFHPPGGRLRVFRPKLLAVERERELRWLGNPGVPGLFESEHYFLLENPADGGAKNLTLLKHNMLFYGLLIPFLAGFLKKSVEANFNLMNEALKRRCELK